MPDEEIIQVRQPANRVIVSTPGPQGPAGPSGVAESFEYLQASPANPWVIDHFMGKYPNVIVIVGLEQVIADVTFNSVDQITIAFGLPQSGRAELI